MIRRWLAIRRPRNAQAVSAGDPPLEETDPALARALRDPRIRKVLSNPEVRRLLRSLTERHLVLLVVAGALLARAIGAAAAGPALVPVQTSAFTAMLPMGWTAQTTEDGKAVAAMGPAYALRGRPFRPNLSISASPLPPQVTLAQAAAIAEGGLARGLPALSRLGQEIARGAGGDVRIGYYLSTSQGIRLYLVTGVTLLAGRWVIVTLGATSADLPMYREHAALFRAAALSVRPK